MVMLIIIHTIIIGHIVRMHGVSDVNFSLSFFNFTFTLSTVSHAVMVGIGFVAYYHLWQLHHA